MRHSARPFVLKGTSFRARHRQTRPASQVQISLSKSHSEPRPYCKRIRDDTSHRYLDLTRKRERERGSSDVQYGDISAYTLKDSFSADLTVMRYKVNFTVMIGKKTTKWQSHMLPSIKKKKKNTNQCKKLTLGEKRIHSDTCCDIT